MEGDVVFADEIEGLGSLVVPPFVPCPRLVGNAGPLDGGRQVTNDCLEPNVQAFAFLSLERHRDAPVQVAGDGAASQAICLDLTERLAHYVLPPLRSTRL